MQAPNPNFAHPTWASARKDMVGASLGPSRIWFTLAQGIVTEVFHPRIDIPQIKDLGFIVADGKGFWVEVRRLESYEVKQPEAGGSSVEVVHRHPRFTLTLKVCPAHRRDVLLVHC
jgi:glucoamylase